MSPTATELLEQALVLDESERASLAGALIISLESPPEGQAVGAWDEVIRSRVQELDSGSVATLPWSEARERLFCGFD